MMRHELGNYKWLEGYENIIKEYTDEEWGGRLACVHAQAKFKYGGVCWDCSKELAKGTEQDGVLEEIERQAKERLMKEEEK
jgi:hypothetical protein